MYSANSVRRTAELLLPGAAVGAVAAFAVGGVALFGGLPADYAVVAALSLGLPLSIFGVGYNLLLARGRVRLGGVAPAVGYWVAGYTVSRLVYEVALDVFAGRPIGFAEGILSFLVFQALLGVGFGIGFMWLHEHAAPLWWVRIRHRNPVAATYVSLYMEQAVVTEQAKEQRKKQRTKGRATGEGAWADAPLRPFAKPRERS